MPRRLDDLDPATMLEQRLGEPLPLATRRNAWLRDAAYQERAERCPGYPGVFEVEPTSACAMRCIHCPRPARLRRAPGHMPPALLDRVAENLFPFAQNLHAAVGDARLAVNFMHYGEPALSPHYAHGVRRLKERGVSVVSSSTASEFDEAAAQAAVEAGLDELWLIFDGMDDETFQRMRGPRASFQRGVERLRALVERKARHAAAKPDIVAVMVRHPENRRQWDRFQAFFADMPGVRGYLAHLSTFNGAHAPLLAALASLEDDPDTQAEQARVAALNAHPCRYPWHSVCVLADGRVVPCCRDVNGDMTLGDLNHQSLLEIWNGPAVRDLRRRFAAGDRNNPLCRSCREASLEIGLPQVPLPPEDLPQHVPSERP